MTSVSLHDINLNDHTFQYRISTTIDDLRDSIAREGQLEPVDLTGGAPFRIIDGFRRVQAMSDLGWPTVTAIVHPGLSEELAHERAFAKNVVRRNLRPLDKANAIRMAKTRGLHISKIALEFGLSQKQLGRYESLLSFSKALQELVDAGELSMEHARQLHAHRMSDVAAWTKRIQDEQLSVLDLRRQLRADSGRRTTGHRRHLIKRDGRLLRVFPFRIHKDAPRVELLAIIKSFRDAIAFLEDDSGDREHGPRNQ